jgi:triacylglycerol lipase
MDPAGLLGLAARQVIMHGTQAAGLMALSMHAALGALSHTAATIARPATVRGLVMESEVVVAHLMMYPWGALTDQLGPGGPYGCYRTDDLAPAERGLVFSDEGSATTPVLLVHGFADNRTAFAVLAQALRKHGFGVVHCVNYSVLTALTSDVRSAAGELAQQVERICAATGAPQVHVVGHSLGGLLARYYVQRLGGDAWVHTLVTLGTPHQGTMTAYLLPTPVLHQLRPDSDIMVELAAPSPRCATRFVALWSELDGWIVPQRNARLDHPDLDVTNYQLHHVGHLSLAVDPHAVHTVVTALTQVQANRPALVPTTPAPENHAITATPNATGSARSASS